MTCFCVRVQKKCSQRPQKKNHVLEHSEACQTALSFYCVALCLKQNCAARRPQQQRLQMCLQTCCGRRKPPRRSFGCQAGSSTSQSSQTKWWYSPSFFPHRSTTSHTAPCCGLNATWGSGTPYKSMHEVGDCVLWHYPLSLFLSTLGFSLMLLLNLRLFLLSV